MDINNSRNVATGQSNTGPLPTMQERGSTSRVRKILPAGYATTFGSPTFPIAGEFTIQPKDAPTWPSTADAALRKVLTPEEWEALKPTLKRLFLDENKKYTQVAQYLREQHNFFPTKRQLEKRFKIWGIKKNTNQNERERILAGHAGESVDRNSVKYKRWVRNSGVDHTQDGGSGENFPKLESLLNDIDNFPESQTPVVTSPRDSDAPEEAPTLERESEVQQQDSHYEVGGTPDLTTVTETEAVSTRALNDELDVEHKTLWDAAKITSSPLLTTFMKALTIDEEIPLLNTQVRQHRDLSPSKLLHGELLGDHRRSNENVESQNGILSLRPVPVHHRTFQRTGSQTAYTQTIFYNFVETINMSFDPYREISPFPLRSASIVKPPNNALTRSKKSIYREITEHQQRLKRLSSILPEGNMGILSELHALADLYNDRDLPYMNEAEALYSKILTVYQKMFGSSHPKTVKVYLDIIKVKMNKGENVEAHEIHSIIHPQILKVYAPDSEIALRSASLLASLYFYLDMHKEEVDMRRPIIQLALNKYGMKHQLTADLLINLLEALAIAFSEVDDDLPGLRKHIKSVEPHLYNIIQVDRRLFLQVHRHLGRVYRDLEEHSESIRVTKMILHSLCDTHQIESKDSYEHLYWLAKSTKLSGDFERAETILNMSLSWQINSLGVDYSYNVLRMTLLADTLTELQYIEEATTRYEEVYRYYTRHLNTTRHPQSLCKYFIAQAMGGLRKVYNLQGLYGGADIAKVDDRHYRWVSLKTVIDETKPVLGTEETAVFEERLKFVEGIEGVTTLHLERRRKWCRYEKGWEVEDLPRRKRRGEGWIGV